MSDGTHRPVLSPGPDHPIFVSNQETRVRIQAGSSVLSENATALELREHVYPPVLYVDRAAIPADRLERSAHTSWCPYKGEANYFHLVLDDGVRLENAVWTYEAPFPAVAGIKDRLGFYTDRVELRVL